MITVFADTSYYLALTNSVDAHHSAAYKYTESFGGNFVTTAWVLTELANSLSRSVNRPLFLSLLNDLQEDPRVTIFPPTSQLFASALDLYARRPDKNWSLTDCVSFVVMEQSKIADALATDHHFEQAGFKLLLK